MPDTRDEEVERLRRALARAEAARWDAEAALIQTGRAERLARDALLRAQAALEVGAGRGGRGEGGDGE